MRLHLAPRDADPPLPSPRAVPFPHAPAPSPPPALARRLSVDSSLHALHRAHERRISNSFHFDAVGRAAAAPLPTPPRPRSISVSSDSHSPVAGRLALPRDDPAPAPAPAPVYAPEQYFMAPPARGLSLGLELAGEPAPLERNRIDVLKIERGDDTRTTVSPPPPAVAGGR